MLSKFNSYEIVMSYLSLLAVYLSLTYREQGVVLLQPVHRSGIVRETTVRMSGHMKACCWLIKVSTAYIYALYTTTPVRMRLNKLFG